MSELQNILAERRKQHGDFSEHAAYTQSIKAVINEVVHRRGARKHTEFTCMQREALDMIAHKIGRILAGDPNHIDHWDDIAGYATLVANELRSRDGGGRSEKAHQRPSGEADGASGE
jgi:uncharacterized protein DUF6378